MAVVGLYAGIGGFELGFQAAGYKPLLLADKDEHCRRVLATRFPDAPIAGDVADLEALPRGTQIVTAGFPCQNLSMAGDKKGLRGRKSRDVRHLFELLEYGGPTLAIENVYFMLHLKKGAAMTGLVREVEELGYRWAYRVVNTLAFGLPQRRRRVFFVASMRVDPRKIVFADETGPPSKEIPSREHPLGFYWTEGRRGVGIAVDAIPPLKIASGLGIPSTPAVLFPDGEVLTPSLAACERLQGFPRGWTDLPFDSKRSPRWTMVGNAVSVPAAEWLASRIKAPGEILDLPMRPLRRGEPWPSAAFGAERERFAVEASEFPILEERPSVAAFRDESWTPLSARALRGFISRAKEGGLRFPADFIPALECALSRAEEKPAPRKSKQ
jgi:DNA (cytosine-5)-methyltransferase 1